MEEQLKELQENIVKNNIREFCVYSYTDMVLTILGSFDICYYQEVLIKFGSVSYAECLTDFMYPLFRLATEDEKNELILKVKYGVSFHNSYVFCICGYDDFHQDYDNIIPESKCFIVANELKIEFGNFTYKFKTGIL